MDVRFCREAATSEALPKGSFFIDGYGRPRLFRIIFVPLVALVLLAFAGCSFTKVGQGHVGVRVNNLGSSAGVDLKPYGVGWYFTPPGVTIYEYPVFTNN